MPRPQAAASRQRSLGLPLAKKSVPAPAPRGDERYTNYLVFVEDPRLKTPFQVLPGNNIVNVKSKLDIDSSYLNKSRRKRAFDVAFSTLFTYPSRIFAKCESSLSLVALHEIVSHLNEKFNMLIMCKVPLEDAYATLMDSYSNKVQEGIEYETGKVTDASARQKHPPDTDSSFSEALAEEGGKKQKVNCLERPSNRADFN